MGTWGDGPLDNDTAAVWRIAFEEASGDRRAGLIRAALAAAVVDRDVYLDSDFAFEAIAAATVLAASGAAFVRDTDLPGLAVAALDRIGSANSEWRSLWEEGGPESLGTGLSVLRQIRARLTPVPVGGVLRRIRARLAPVPGAERRPCPVDDGDGAGPLIYLTYTKYHPGTRQVYTGRISGRGDPREILAAYDRHHPLTAQGFERAVADVWIQATKPPSARLTDRAYQAIRGREQGGIDANGGARSQTRRG